MSMQDKNGMITLGDGSSWLGQVRVVSMPSALKESHVYYHPDVDAMLKDVIPKTSSYVVENMKSLNPEMSTHAFCVDGDGKKILKCIMNVVPVESTHSVFPGQSVNKHVTMWVPKKDGQRIVLVGDKFDSNNANLYKCPVTSERVIPVWSSMTCRELIDTVNKAHGIFDVQDALNDGVGVVPASTGTELNSSLIPVQEDTSMDMKASGDDVAQTASKLDTKQKSASNESVNDAVASECPGAVAQTASKRDDESSDEDSSMSSDDSSMSSDDSSTSSESSDSSDSDTESDSSQDESSGESSDESEEASEESSSSGSEDEEVAKGGVRIQENEGDLSNAFVCEDSSSDSESDSGSSSCTSSDSSSGSESDDYAPMQVLKDATTKTKILCPSCTEKNMTEELSDSEESESDLPHSILHGKIEYN